MPRSLRARLFVAIGGVSIVALALGAWLVQRALRLDIREEVVVREPAADGATRESRQTVTRTPEPSRPSPAVLLNRRVLIALLLVLLGSAVATALLAQRLVRPLAALRDAADRLARGDRLARVEADGADEIAALGRAFNTMAARIDDDERQRRDLTNDVAHELRTPLTNLRCHLEALDDGVSPMTADTVRTLLDEVGQLQHLVEDLTDLARAEASQLSLQVEPIDLADAIATLVREAAPRAARQQVALEPRVPPNLPPVRADRGRLAQVLRNVVDNAIVHTSAGGRIVIDAAAKDSIATILVRDTGPGIAPEHLPRVFDRFYRADASRSRETGGAGLGLAIVRQLVEAHGGRVAAESAPGRGTTIAIEWPLASSDLHN